MSVVGQQDANTPMTDFFAVSVARGTRLSRCRTFADDNEGRPVRGVRFVSVSFVDQCQHGLAQSFGSTDVLIGRHPAHSARDQFDGRIGIDRPVRDEQG
jgi:hypothetical protein